MSSWSCSTASKAAPLRPPAPPPVDGPAHAHSVPCRTRSRRLDRGPLGPPGQWATGPKCHQLSTRPHTYAHGTRANDLHVLPRHSQVPKALLQRLTKCLGETLAREPNANSRRVLMMSLLEEKVVHSR